MSLPRRAQSARPNPVPASPTGPDAPAAPADDIDTLMMRIGMRHGAHVAAHYCAALTGHQELVDQVDAAIRAGRRPGVFPGELVLTRQAATLDDFLRLITPGGAR